MTLLAIRLKASSMIAAPGSSILPSRSTSSRLPPWARQATSRLSIVWACGVGAVEPFSSLAQQRHRVDRADVLGGGGVHRRGHRGGRPLAVLLQPLQVAVEQVHPADRAVPPPLVVGGAEAVRDAVVPVGHEAVPVVHPVRVARRGQEPAPLELAGALGRQSGVHGPGHGSAAGRSCTRRCACCRCRRS